MTREEIWDKVEKVFNSRKDGQLLYATRSYAILTGCGLAKALEDCKKHFGL